jgi:hypothetical protein
MVKWLLGYGVMELWVIGLYGLWHIAYSLWLIAYGLWLMAYGSLI